MSDVAVDSNDHSLCVHVYVGCDVWGGYVVCMCGVCVLFRPLLFILKVVMMALQSNPWVSLGFLRFP